MSSSLKHSSRTGRRPLTSRHLASDARRQNLAFCDPLGLPPSGVRESNQDTMICTAGRVGCAYPARSSIGHILEALGKTGTDRKAECWRNPQTSFSCHHSARGILAGTDPPETRWHTISTRMAQRPAAFRPPSRQHRPRVEDTQLAFVQQLEQFVGNRPICAAPTLAQFTSKPSPQTRNAGFLRPCSHLVGRKSPRRADGRVSSFCPMAHVTGSLAVEGASCPFASEARQNMCGPPPQERGIIRAGLWAGSRVD